MPTRKIVRIYTRLEDGYADISGYCVGSTMAVHPPLLLPDEAELRHRWVVSHRRTGLTAGEMDTLVEAKAYAQGFDRVFTHLGDAGSWGDGKAVAGDGGRRSKAINRYVVLVRQERVDEVLLGTRTVPVRLTTTQARRLADQAVQETA